MSWSRTPQAKFLIKGLRVLGQAFLKTAADVFAQFEDAGIGNGIEHLETFLPAREKPGTGKSIEVARGVGLRQTRRLNELSHALLPCLEHVNQFEPAGFAEDAEAGGDELKGLVGEVESGRRNFRHNQKQ